MFFSFVFISCEKKANTEPCEPENTIETLNYEITSTSTLEEDNLTLSELYNEFSDLSESIACTDASLWKYTAYGSKACGGPIGYMAYSECINTNDFLNKIEKYTTLQNTYNNKYGVVSTCDVPPPPTSINCVNGEAVLGY